MRTFYGMAAAILAASQLASHDFYLDVRGRDRQRNAPKTFKYPYRMVIDVEDIDLLGKSHGKGASKRKRQRARALT